jgi:hypothetical protein
MDSRHNLVGAAAAVAGGGCKLLVVPKGPTQGLSLAKPVCAKRTDGQTLAYAGRHKSLQAQLEEA